MRKLSTIAVFLAPLLSATFVVFVMLRTDRKIIQGESPSFEVAVRWLGPPVPADDLNARSEKLAGINVKAVAWSAANGVQTIFIAVAWILFGFTIVCSRRIAAIGFAVVAAVATWFLVYGVGAGEPFPECGDRRLTAPAMLDNAVLTWHTGFNPRGDVRREAGKPCDAEQEKRWRHESGISRMINRSNAGVAVLILLAALAVGTVITEPPQGNPRVERARLERQAAVLVRLLNLGAVVLVVGVVQIGCEFQWAAALIINPGDTAKDWQPAIDLANTYTGWCAALFSLHLAAIFTPAIAWTKYRFDDFNRTWPANPVVFRWEQFYLNAAKVLSPLLTAYPLTNLVFG